MGFKWFSDDPAAPNPNPDPKNFTIISWEQIGEYVLAIVKYPDCTTFEGLKISVYRGYGSELNTRKTLDPHFRDSPDAPVARFPATQDGLIMANVLCKALKNG